MKVLRKIIMIDEKQCNGCGQCVPACAEGAIQVIDGKARLVAEKYCDGLGACLGGCPTGALRIVEREADEFDEEAVGAFLKPRQQAQNQTEATLPCGCPSAQIQSFSPHSLCHEANEPTEHASGKSALPHWPVQIRLVPPSAPFLKGAHLLVAANCTTVAYPNFHQDFLKGKVIMVGCPRFDEVQTDIQKFADIFGTADIKRITAVVMEVPCCQGLPVIIRKGMEVAGKTIPMDQRVITTKGEVLESERLVA